MSVHHNDELLAKTQTIDTASQEKLKEAIAKTRARSEAAIDRIAGGTYALAEYKPELESCGVYRVQRHNGSDYTIVADSLLKAVMLAGEGGSKVSAAEFVCDAWQEKK